VKAVSEQQFQPGEIVRVIIEAPVIEQHTDRLLAIKRQNGALLIDLDIEGTTIEHVAPAEWPPRKNDVWRDRHGELLIGAVWAAEGPVLRSLDGSDYDTAYALALLAPLTLVIRDGQPVPAPTEQDDAPVEEIAKAMSGAEAEINSNDCPRWDDLRDSGQDAYRQAAAFMLRRFRIATREQQDGGELRG
jgi:hypothetical protein